MKFNEYLEMAKSPSDISTSDIALDIVEAAMAHNNPKEAAKNIIETINHIVTEMLKREGI